MLQKAPKTYWSTCEQAPSVAATAYIADTATVTGHVEISEGVMVCPGASVRGDEGMPIFIGPHSNIQDGAVLHGLMGQRQEVNGRSYSIYIGDRVSCGHCCVIHGPSVVAHDTFVGFNAAVVGSVVADHVYIGHGAQVIGVHIPAGRYVAHGTTVCTQAVADALPEVPEDIRTFNAEVVDKNSELARNYGK